MDKISAKQAVNRGYLAVNLPVLIIMVGTIALSFYLVETTVLPAWSIPLSFLFGPALAWLYWSYTITKWRLWAFENVRNVHELKKRAIERKLIWPDGSSFVTTEIRTAAEEAKWKELQRKFKKADVFTDDLTIPEETIIHYARERIFLEMIFMLGVIAFGAYSINNHLSYFWGRAFIMVGVLAVYYKFKQLTNTTPQIIINDEGMSTIKASFYPWSEIADEDVVRGGTRRRPKYFLSYRYPSGNVHLQIGDYDIGRKQLSKLLTTYRGRYDKKKR